MVKPYWCELWNDYLSNRETANRGPGFNVVQLRAIVWEAPKYSSPTTKDKSDWDDVDHYACFLHNVREVNLRRDQGVFFNKGFSDDHMDELVWALKGYLRSLHYPSKINKPGGGRAIFGSFLTGMIYWFIYFYFYFLVEGILAHLSIYLDEQDTDDEKEDSPGKEIEHASDIDTHADIVDTENDEVKERGKR